MRKQDAALIQFKPEGKCFELHKRQADRFPGTKGNLLYSLPTTMQKATRAERESSLQEGWKTHALQNQDCFCATLTALQDSLGNSSIWGLVCHLPSPRAPLGFTVLQRTLVLVLLQQPSSLSPHGGHTKEGTVSRPSGGKVPMYQFAPTEGKSFR